MGKDLITLTRLELYPEIRFARIFFSNTETEPLSKQFPISEIFVIGIQEERSLIFLSKGKRRYSAYAIYPNGNIDEFNREESPPPESRLSSEIISAVTSVIKTRGKSVDLSIDIPDTEKLQIEDVKAILAFYKSVKLSNARAILHPPPGLVSYIEEAGRTGDIAIVELVERTFKLMEISDLDLSQAQLFNYLISRYKEGIPEMTLAIRSNYTREHYHRIMFKPALELFLAFTKLKTPIKR